MVDLGKPLVFTEKQKELLKKIGAFSELLSAMERVRNVFFDHIDIQNKLNNALEKVAAIERLLEEIRGLAGYARKGKPYARKQLTIIIEKIDEAMPKKEGE